MSPTGPGRGPCSRHRCSLGVSSWCVWHCMQRHVAASRAVHRARPRHPMPRPSKHAPRIPCSPLHCPAKLTSKIAPYIKPGRTRLNQGAVESTLPLLEAQVVQDCWVSGSELSYTPATVMM